MQKKRQNKTMELLFHRRQMFRHINLLVVSQHLSIPPIIWITGAEAPFRLDPEACDE